MEPSAYCTCRICYSCAYVYFFLLSFLKVSSLAGKSLHLIQRRTIAIQPLTPEERQSIHAQFCAIDTDGSGALDRTEIKVLSENLYFGLF